MWERAGCKCLRFTFTPTQTLPARRRDVDAAGGHLEVLRLSGQAHGVHHGDEDGDVTQRAAHPARYTDAQRISGAFGELHRPDVLMIDS